jgi:hypothetical protein
VYVCVDDYKRSIVDLLCVHRPENADEYGIGFDILLLRFSLSLLF